MSKKNFIVIMTFILGCSHHPKKLSDIVRKDEKHVMKSFSVNDSQEAESKISNRLNYLRLLFEQSSEPYMNASKWNDSCFQNNRVGEVSKSKDAIFAISRLNLDGLRVEGHCSDKIYANPGYSIDVYCVGEKSLKQFRFVSAEEISWENVNLCQ